MTVYKLLYGHDYQTLELPDNTSVDWIEPQYTSPAPDPLQVVCDALAKPVDGSRLKDRGTVKSVAIAINDKTRPVPHEHLLPPLLDELHAAGIPRQAIRFFIATGTHIPMPAEEFERVLPAEIARQYAVVSHNCDDESNLVDLGVTPSGTLVRANRAYVESDLKIVVGNIEPHHFAGFSGGYKTAAIGLSSRQTINQNHTMLVEPEARIAEFTHNPLRQDIEAIGEKIGVDFALNVILNGEKKIVEAVSGSPKAVMQAGIPISQRICQVAAKTPAAKTSGAAGKYDLVIASVGGAPKDINFYQSQKALTHASLYTREGGIIVLVAECPEGSGSASYETFMQGVSSVQAVFDKFRQIGFRVGPHKAFQVARIASQAQIVVVSSMPRELVTNLLMTPAHNLQSAYQQAIAQLSSAPGAAAPRIAILPRATNTIPVF